jgi:subtilisin family serine protease
MATTASTIRLYARSRSPLTEAVFRSQPSSAGNTRLARVEKAALHAPAGLQWHALSMPINAGLKPWDAAHAAADHIAKTSGTPAYVEPDVLQETFRGKVPAPRNRLSTRKLSTRKGALAAPVEADALDPAWPPSAADKPLPDWHLDSSQLRQARQDAQVLANAATTRVRIGHLDTGYSPAHETRPQFLLTDLAWDVLDDRPGAIDPADYSGLLQTPGHGTATLAILAGSHCSLTHDQLGGAPMCEVLPVRISDSVVHLWTSVIPKGINYALDNGCDVISLSHGGLPSMAWSDAVNRAYDQGVVICAASGDSKGGWPMTAVVYPARFRRAISVCGVTAAGKPYFDDKFDGTDELEGNFGPAEVMGNAIAAYTPNVLWAKIRDTPDAKTYSKNGYELSGSGTSASTPQVAAAVALYLQKNYAALKAMAGGKRVEAIRAALFAQAQSAGDALHFGHGFLRALDLLDYPVKAPAKTLDDDEIVFALLGRLPGWAALPVEKQQMFNVEAMQVVLASADLTKTMDGAETDASGLGAADIVKLVGALRNADISQALHQFLDDAMTQLGQ